jgi:asparaginyl-tRNA synthetase
LTPRAFAAASAAANEKFEFPVKWASTCSRRARALSDRKAAKKPVIVMNYPKNIKATYMRVNDDGRTVAAMDVLAPGIGEIIGSLLRMRWLSSNRP